MSYLDFATYFLLFFIYSFLGWLLEVIYSLYDDKKFINRGFLIGPYCPIYGFGCVLILILLKGFSHHPVALFMSGVIICSALEYFTGFMMEKLFKTRWWDYSNRKFNLNGRICLETMLPFGIGLLIIWYVVNPFILKIFSLVPNVVLISIAIVIFILMFIDVIISFNVINSYKKTIKKVSVRDMTEDVNNYVRGVFGKESVLKRRLLKAFPKFNIGDITKKIKDNTINKNKNK